MFLYVCGSPLHGPPLSSIRYANMSHLEDLLVQYYDWKGYLVKRNIKVGKLPHGGWEMELDIVAYDAHSGDLVHIEPSLDADSWERREERFLKKFKAGKKYVFSDVFTWLDPGTSIRQVAVLVSAGSDRRELAGGQVRTVDEFVKEIRVAVANEGIVGKAAIPEQFPLLRTIQLVLCGYYRVL